MNTALCGMRAGLRAGLRPMTGFADQVSELSLE